MKSLFMSAPFLKTVSGMRTRGLPELDIANEASLFRVLSSLFRIVSTREGTWGAETNWEE